MATVKIITDSTCDLTKELFDRHDIDVLPLYVTLGQDSYADGVSIRPSDIYEYFERTKETPKTSASTVADFHEAFKPYAKEGRDIVFIGISSKMSATLDQARLAAKEFPQIRIRCVDSLNLSTGVGLCVLRACELAVQGLSADAIYDRLTAVVPLVRASFIIDTMTFLYRGGRCSAVKAYGATLLRIKPQITVTDGKMHPSEKYRGSIAYAARTYADRVLTDLEAIDPRRVFITYTEGTDAEVIDAVREVVKGRDYFGEISETTAGCVITSHCGRNVIGVIFALREAQA